jgi:subtilisin
VAATDEDDVRAPFTNYGRQATVGAPGVRIVGPWRDGTYGVGSGTSYATPIVSGTVALILGANLDRGQSSVLRRISGRADRIDALNGGWLGFGRLNIPATLLR